MTQKATAGDVVWTLVALAGWAGALVCMAIGLVAGVFILFFSGAIIIQSVRADRLERRVEKVEEQIGHKGVGWH